MTWALILLGAFEVPWVIYLVFTQQESFKAYHLNLATIGLSTASAVIAGLACLALMQDWVAAPALCVATATVVLFLSSVTSLSRNLGSRIALSPDHVSLFIAVPGAIAAAYAAYVCLRGRQREDALGLMIAAVVVGLVAAAFAVRTVQHITDHHSTAFVTQARAIVVLLDTGEAVGLLGAGIASLKGRPKPTLVFSTMGAVLLICDAWTNMLTAASGLSFDSAVFYLIVGEVPAIVVCLWAARSALRVLRVERASAMPMAG